jgi:hypothetical protein
VRIAPVVSSCEQKIKHEKLKAMREALVKYWENSQDVRSFHIHLCAFVLACAAVCALGARMRCCPVPWLLACTPVMYDLGARM